MRPMVLPPDAYYRRVRALEAPTRNTAMPETECPTCHKSFVNVAAYQQHARDKRHPVVAAVAATLGAHGCTTCNVDFASQLALQQHYRASSSHPTCSRCLEAFKDQTQLSAHLALVHLTRCSQCNIPIYRDELEQHYKSSQKHPACDVCTASFENDRLLDEHIMSSHPELRCVPCERLFRSHTAVQTHYKDSSAHPVCTLCSVTIGFKDDAAYDQHEASSHPGLRCTLCERLFRSAAAMQAHYKDSSIHPLCTLCSVRFKDNSAYDEHEASSHPGLRCTLCERLFRSGAAIQDHYKDSSAHPHCTLCSVTVGFRDNAAYDEHIASSHPELRCAPCRQVFHSGAEVQEHYRDSSAHPLCTLCSVGFKDNAAYDEHIASSHPELRCTPCRQVFHSGAEVQEHYRDSSAHPLCTLCSIGFKDNGAYDEHIASRHPPPPPKPLVVETSSPQMIQTFVEDSTPTPRSVTVDLLSAPFTPRSRQSMNLTLATELPTPLTDVSQFRHSLLGESSHSTSAHRAVSEPTLPSASSLRAGSGAVSQTPTSPAMTERTLEYIRSSALRAGNAISRLSRTPSPAMSRSFSLRGLRHKRPESVSSESLQSLHSSDVDSDTKSPNFDTLSSPENELPGPIHALLTPAEIAARGTKTPEPRQRSDVEKTPTRLPDPPSNSRSVAASETPSRRGEPRVPREHVPMAPTPVRSYSKVSISRLSSVRRSMSAASRLSVHGVSDDTDDTVRENPKLPTDDSARTSTVAKGLSWHCRVCQRDPCVQPTATMCGHIFCNSCIIRELSDNMQCPVCKKTMLLRLHVETD